MSEFDSQKSRRKRHPIRNFFVTFLLIAVLFLTALFGDFFPGLKGLRNTLLEQQAYIVTQTSPDASAASAADSNQVIVIAEYKIYYMGKETTLDALSASLDEANLMDVTISDYKGTAKQKTWEEVSTLLTEKGLAVNENVIQ
jgi:hypothetical protein